MKKIILPLLVVAASGAYVVSQQGRIAAENAAGSLPSLDASTAVAPPAPAAVEPAALTTAPTAPAPRVAEVPAPPPASLPLVDLPADAAAATPAPAPAAPAGDTPEVQQAVSTPDITQPVAAPVQAASPLADAPPEPLPRLQRPAAAAPAIVLAAATVPASGRYKDGAYRGAAEDAYYGTVQVEADVRNGQIATVRILQYPNDRRTSRYINSQALPILKQEAIEAQSGNVDFVSGATLTSQAYVQSLSSALDQAAP